jgi:glutathione S-transferase
MKLFWTPASPFTRKVMVSARELGLERDIEIIPTTWPHGWGYSQVPLNRELSDASPVARIPTLITDDGVILVDSTTICLHLDTLAGGNVLLPAGTAASRTWSLYGIADAIIESQIAIRAESLRRAGARCESFIAKHAARIDRCFDVLESRATELECRPEQRPDLAMIAAGVACGYQDWRDWLVDFRVGRPRLAHCSDVFGARPSMQSTMPQETPQH